MELEKFTPQKEKWHTWPGRAPGSVQEEGSVRLVPGRAGPQRQPAASFLTREGRDCCQAGPATGQRVWELKPVGFPTHRDMGGGKTDSGDFTL